MSDDPAQSVAADPVALLPCCPQLAARNFQPAAVLNTYPHRRVARAASSLRQRPQTAKGVIFVTLEDETGPVNVVVRTELIERQRRELLGSSLLGVYGAWQNVDGVRHLIAQRLVDMSELLGGRARRAGTSIEAIRLCLVYHVFLLGTDMRPGPRRIFA